MDKVVYSFWFLPEFYSQTHGSKEGHKIDSQLVTVTGIILEKRITVLWLAGELGRVGNFENIKELVWKDLGVMIFVQYLS